METFTTDVETFAIDRLASVWIVPVFHFWIRVATECDGMVTSRMMLPVWMATEMAALDTLTAAAISEPMASSAVGSRSVAMPESVTQTTTAVSKRSSAADVGKFDGIAVGAALGDTDGTMDGAGLGAIDGTCDTSWTLGCYTMDRGVDIAMDHGIDMPGAVGSICHGPSNRYAVGCGSI